MPKFEIEYIVTERVLNKVVIDADSLDDAEQIINDEFSDLQDVCLVDSLECSASVVSIVDLDNTAKIS